MDKGVVGSSELAGRKEVTVDILRIVEAAAAVVVLDSRFGYCTGAVGRMVAVGYIEVAGNFADRAGAETRKDKEAASPDCLVGPDMVETGDASWWVRRSE